MFVSIILVVCVPKDAIKFAKIGEEVRRTFVALFVYTTAGLGFCFELFFYDVMRRVTNQSDAF